VRQVDNKHGGGNSIAESEKELARARLAFGEGLQAATEAGTRSLAAARRLVVPALWGAALLGGAVAVFAVARLVCRRRRENALIRVVVQSARTERSLARTAGAALARLAIERLLASVRDAGAASALSASNLEQRPGAAGSEYRGRLDSSGVQGKSITNGRQETIG